MKVLLVLAAAGIVLALFFLRGSPPPPAKPAAAPAVRNSGIIGDELRAGNMFAEVIDLATSKFPDRDLTVVGVLGCLGNGSSAPLAAPPVQLNLFDDQNRQYAPKETAGKYEPAALLNPGLRIEHRWVFMLPAKAVITRAEFTFNNENDKATVDLSQRTAKNTEAIKSPAHAPVMSVLEQMVQTAGKPPVIDNSLAEKRAAATELKVKTTIAAWANVEAQKIKLQALDGRRKALEAAIEAGEKGLKPLNDELEKQQAAHRAARDAQTRTRNWQRDAAEKLRMYQQQNPKRGEPREITLIADLNKASKELASQEKAAEAVRSGIADKTHQMLQQRDAVGRLTDELRKLDGEYEQETQTLKQLETVAEQAEVKAVELEKKLAPKEAAPEAPAPAAVPAK